MFIDPKGAEESIVVIVVIVITARKAECLNSNAEVAIEKVFDVDSAAPTIAIEAIIIVKINHFAIEEEERMVIEEIIIIVVVIRERISAPEPDVPFKIGVEFRTRRWRHLLHFLSGITFRSGKGPCC